ncbi:MAG: carbonic anhydrase family protein [Chloroflexi bacterium]|nr:carbonic anhydrase family protein [Chloroflexota bacterium]
MPTLFSGRMKRLLGQPLPWLLAGGVLLLFAACDPEEEVQGDSGGNEKEVSWSYLGKTGPGHWAELSPEFALCRDGLMQSPIAVEEVLAEEMEAPSFDYHPTPLRLHNDGHTVHVNYASGSAMVLEGVAYELVQFHFHTPSEHTVWGFSYPVELHLVHASTEGSVAILGVLMEPGAANGALEALLEDLPRETGEERQRDDLVNAGDLLPVGRETYRYMGSLTTPPCTEGVQWLLLVEPVEVSLEQIGALQTVLLGNHRPEQPLNDRQVLLETAVQ